MTHERPTGISILAGFLILLGVVNAVGFLVLVPRAGGFHYADNVPAVAIKVVEFLGKGGLLAVALLLDTLIVAVGFGLWGLRNWARVTLLVVSLMNLGSACFVFFSTLSRESSFSFNSLINACFYGWLIYYLNTPTTKGAFGVERTV